MGKRLIGVIAFAAIAVAAGWNYQLNTNEVQLSDLALENVEALANGESGTNRRYQTMGYCSPSQMNYMCTSRQTAESCRRDCP